MAQPSTAIIATGSLGTTATGVLATLTVPAGQNLYTTFRCIIDAATGVTGAGTAAIQTQSSQGGTFQTDTGISGNPFTIAAGAYTSVTVPGPQFGVQINLTAHGTSGTINGAILAN